MKVYAKLHRIDKDQVEVMDDAHKWLLCVIHIDSLDEVNPREAKNQLGKPQSIASRLLDDEEIALAVMEW